MKRQFPKIFIFLTILFIANVSALNADFAIYTGSGTWDDSIIAFKNFLEWKGLTWEEVNAWDINKKDLRPLYKGIFFPGGWAYNYKIAIKPAGEQHIRDLVSNGGAYIGMSAGAFYACDNVVWEGDSFDYPLKLFNGDCIGPIEEIAPWPNYVMTTMNINQAHEANIYEPQTEDILYYGEPYFVANSGQEMQVLASWIVPSNPALDNTPGIIGFNYGQGRVLLVGPHPEIEENSDRDGTNFGSELNDNGSDWPFLWTAMDWLLKAQISQPPGTIPPAPAQCNDGIDNDNDSLTDYPADLGCTSLQDNDETDQTQPPTPTEIFFDGFESCNLNGWILSTVENNWYAGTTNPYAGSCYAETKPMNTNEPASTMEKTISTLGFTNIELSYYRRLVELDSGDEFKAKWFDGSSWTVLEETAGNSARNSDYQYKSFVLPSAAENNPNFQIKFECTAGAVSEFCRIDNVKILGE